MICLDSYFKIMNMFPIFKYSFISILFVSILLISCNEDEKIDNEKPTIAILTPANNSEFFVDEDVKITANSNDNIGISKVSLFVNGVIMATFDKGGIEYTLSSENRDPEISNITIYAEAEDMSGNVGVSNIINIKIIKWPKGTLTGLVKNSVGVGIPDAKVVLSGDLNIEVRTNENGNYGIEDIEPGDYALTISKDYYEEASGDITIKENSNEFNVTLISLILGQVESISLQEGDQEIVIIVNDQFQSTLAGYNIYGRFWYAHSDQRYIQNSTLYKVYSDWQKINSEVITTGSYTFESQRYNASYGYYVLPVNIDNVETAKDESTIAKYIDLPNNIKKIAEFELTEITDKIAIPNTTHEIALDMNYFYTDYIEIFGFGPWSVLASFDGNQWETVGIVEFGSGDWPKYDYGYSYKFSLNQYKGKSIYFKTQPTSWSGFPSDPQINHNIYEYSNDGSPFISSPQVTTTDVSSITSTSAVSGGNITDDGGAAVTESGVYWGTATSPETTGTKLGIGSGTGVFSGSLTGLTANTTYYVKAYAVNIFGEALGNEVSFVTSSSNSNDIVFNPNLSYGSVSDIDGNTYKTIQIGTQEWMAENLKTTKYSDGTAVTLVADNTTWGNLTTEAHCWYNNDETTYKPEYGALYNWYAVNTGKLCPAGWHVPSDAEWTSIVTYLGGYDVAGGKMKETGTTHWNSPNTGATNESGFTGLPGGLRFGGSGHYSYFITYGFWWYSTEEDTINALQRHLSYDDDGVYIFHSPKVDGVSVRCLKD